MGQTAISDGEHAHSIAQWLVRPFLREDEPPLLPASPSHPLPLPPLRTTVHFTLRLLVLGNAGAATTRDVKQTITPSQSPNM